MFQGFGSDAREFFLELEENNNRNWFAANKQRYEELVLQPAMEFVSSLADPLRKVSPHFLTVPKRSGGSIMRIYRDVRFSKNKLPFKTNLGVHLRHEKGKDAHSPGFYFHLSADSVFMGGGIWQPEIGLLNQIRYFVCDEADRWKRIKRNKKLLEAFYFDGSSLMRCPKGFEDNHPLIDDLKRKDHFVVADLTWDDVADPSFSSFFISRVKIAMPYMRFLCDALRLPS